MRDPVGRTVAIAKADAARQLVYAVVLEPRDASNPDTQGDWYSAAEVEKAAHGFMAAVAMRTAGSDVMHDGGPLVGHPVESFIAPVGFTLGNQVPLPAGCTMPATGSSGFFHGPVQLLPVPGHTRLRRERR